MDTADQTAQAVGPEMWLYWQDYSRPCSLISWVQLAQIWRQQPPCHSLCITYYFVDQTHAIQLCAIFICQFLVTRLIYIFTPRLYSVSSRFLLLWKQDLVPFCSRLLTPQRESGDHFTEKTRWSPLSVGTKIFVLKVSCSPSVFFRDFAWGYSSPVENFRI